jgi:hypothetical protein
LKCLGKIWRTRQKFQLTWMGQQGVKGFLSRVLTKVNLVDPKGVIRICR